MNFFQRWQMINTVPWSKRVCRCLMHCIDRTKSFIKHTSPRNGIKTSLMFCSRWNGELMWFSKTPVSFNNMCFDIVWCTPYVLPNINNLWNNHLREYIWLPGRIQIHEPSVFFFLRKKKMCFIEYFIINFTIFFARRVPAYIVYYINYFIAAN